MKRAGLGPYLEQWVIGATFIAAPLAYLIAQVLLATMPRELTLFATLTAHAEIWHLSHMLLVAWLVLLIPLVWGMGQLLGHHGAFYRTTGGLLVVIGVVVIAMITGVDFVLGAIASLDENRSLALVHQRISAEVLLPLDQLDIALPFGLMLLAIGLYRTRATPQWVALMVLIGLAIPSSTDFRIAAGVVQLAGMTALGLLVVRTSYAGGSREATGYKYAHPMAGALVTALAVLPGAVFSFERLALGVVVWAGLTLPELWNQRGAWQRRNRG